MSRPETTIFIVDDDPAVRRSLTRLVRSAGWNAETFASASEFLARPHFSGTGCVMLDVRMPKMTGPELHEHMAARKISLPVIFLTGHGDLPTGIDEMKKGAVDFLVKPVDGEALLQTIRLALDRHRAHRVHEQQQESIHQRLAKLSIREREVMEYVIAGCLNKQIAEELGIAEKTVKVHRGRLMQKMEVFSVAELVRLCEMGGVPPRKPAAV
jgi:RNA polymerase sigma factor (sigma-70 family)